MLISFILEAGTSIFSELTSANLSPAPDITHIPVNPCENTGSLARASAFSCRVCAETMVETTNRKDITAICLFIFEVHLYRRQN